MFYLQSSDIFPFLRIKAHLPSPVGDSPLPYPTPRPCRSPPGPPPHLGVQAHQTPGHPSPKPHSLPLLGLYPLSAMLILPCLMAQVSFTQNLPRLPGQAGYLSLLSLDAVTPTTPSYDFFTGWLLTFLLSVRVFRAGTLFHFFYNSLALPYIRHSTYIGEIERWGGGGTVVT